MKKLIATALSLCLLSASAWADLLAVGSTAPQFNLPAAQAGEALRVDTKALIKQGPLVVYFYPAAYTSGCSIEAKMFADAMPRFQALGASVVGVSGDDIEKLKRFSVSHCMGKFPVAADEDLKVASQYKAKTALFGLFANRVSYVLDQQGKIVAALTGLTPEGHVTESLKVIEKLVNK